MKKPNHFLIILLLVLISFLISKRTPATERTIPKAPRPDLTISQINTPNSFSSHSPQPLSPPETLLPMKNKKEPRHFSPKEVEEIRHKTKAFLASIYVSQMAFHTEYNQYFTDVKAIGVSHDPVLLFKAGFLESSDEIKDVPTEYDFDSRRLSTDFLIGERDPKTNETIEYAKHAREVDLSAYRELCLHRCTADRDTFEMIVATPLGHPDRVDVWLVNEKKEFILVKDGTNAQEAK